MVDFSKHLKKPLKEIAEEVDLADLFTPLSKAEPEREWFGQTVKEAEHYRAIKALKTIADGLLVLEQRLADPDSVPIDAEDLQPYLQGIRKALSRGLPHPTNALSSHRMLKCRLGRAEPVNTTRFLDGLGKIEDEIKPEDIPF